MYTQYAINWTQKLTYKLRGTFKAFVVSGRHWSLDISTDWTAAQQMYIQSYQLTRNSTVDIILRTQIYHSTTFKGSFIGFLSIDFIRLLVWCQWSSVTGTLTNVIDWLIDTFHFVFAYFSRVIAVIYAQESGTRSWYQKLAQVSCIKNVVQVLKFMEKYALNRAVSHLVQVSGARFLSMRLARLST